MIRIILVNNVFDISQILHGSKVCLINSLVSSTLLRPLPFRSNTNENVLPNHRKGFLSERGL